MKNDLPDDLPSIEEVLRDPAASLWLKTPCVLLWSVTRLMLQTMLRYWHGCWIEDAAQSSASSTRTEDQVRRCYGKKRK